MEVFYFVSDTVHEKKIAAKLKEKHVEFKIHRVIEAVVTFEVYYSCTVQLYEIGRLVGKIEGRIKVIRVKG